MSNLITTKSVSVLYVIAYLCVMFFLFPPESVASGVGLLARQSLYYFVPLMCIWYGDEIEDYVGIFPGPTENAQTPGWILKLGGWILLFLPAVMTVFYLRY